MNNRKRNRHEIKRVLVVGSWAKEEITIENLKRDSGMEVYCYMDTVNPGITGRADDIRVGRLDDVGDIVNYAGQKNADLTLITTAAPLNAGLVDAMIKENLHVFGPTRQAAKLESDKAFTRNLMSRHIPEAIPDFKVCETLEEALWFAENLKWRVAVKPVGLTDGLGVKVWGLQLENEREVEEYIRQIIEQKISGDSRVIVEEKMTGEEFTIQCFVHGNHFIPTPAVQDFKKLLDGERGPNTASMGSYSDSGWLLPFMNQADYQAAVQIIKKTLAAFNQETGGWCSGFLYGQFMLCADGVRLVEYNFRPGDPEWMNTVAVLDDNIANIINTLMDGKSQRSKFMKKATVCKYLVPPDYPEKLYQELDVKLNTLQLDNQDVDIYWSCGVTDDGRMNVGTERGVALLANAETINLAYQKIEKAVSTVQGNFHYRGDIGSPPLIKSKIDSVKQITKQEIQFRTAKETEFMEVRQFVSDCPPLEAYPDHVYKILLRYFGNSCLVVHWRERIIGFVLGFISQTHTPVTYFLWQIGVAPYMQGSGLGKQMLEEVENIARTLGCHKMQLTVDPTNQPSQKLFEKNGYSNISTDEGVTVEVLGNPAVKDYYKPGRHFMLFEKSIGGEESKA
jgi:phosphoribosylamine--glycine ligase